MHFRSLRHTLLIHTSVFPGFPFLSSHGDCVVLPHQTWFAPGTKGWGGARLEPRTAGRGGTWIPKKQSLTWALERASTFAIRSRRAGMPSSTFSFIYLFSKTASLQLGSVSGFRFLPFFFCLFSSNMNRLKSSMRKYMCSTEGGDDTPEL